MKAFAERSPDIAQLKKDWAALYEIAAPNFYLSPPWISTWLGRANSVAPLCAVRVFGDTGDPIAIGVIGGPVMRNRFGFAQARLHESAIDSLDRIYIEYNDFLIAENLDHDAGANARAAAVEALVRANPEVEEFVFRNATPGLCAVLDRNTHVLGARLETVRVETTFQISLKGGDWSDFEPASSSLRGKLRRSEKLYSERGAVRLKPAVTQTEKQAAWRDLNNLHTAAWRRRGLRGALENPDVHAFLEDFLENHPASAELLRLSAGDQTIGVLLNFIEGKTAHNYQSGFLLEDDNRLAPGFLAHALAAAQYQQRQFEIYDLLAGDANYKMRLGEPGETLKTMTLTRKGVKLTVRNLTKAIRRRFANDAGKRQT